jgi:hypothetical protein
MSFSCDTRSSCPKKSLEKLFRYPIGPVPWALATADGCLVKTCKAQLLHILEGNVPKPEMPPLERAVYVLDGNAILRRV